MKFSPISGGAAEGAERLQPALPGSAIHARWSRTSFPQDKSNVLRPVTYGCIENTRYCGLNLTCTIDSGIFPSAAVIGP
jgi:hypothetical protein